MKLIWSGFLILFLLISSCNNPSGSKNIAENTDLLNMGAQDSAVKPQSNFFMFANGNWIKRTEIPPSQSSWGAMSTLLDSSIIRLHRILDSLSAISNAPAGSVSQQTGDLFMSAMDSAGIEKKGYLPVKSELYGISAIQSKEALYQEIAKEYSANHAPFFSFTVSPDDRNSLVNMVHFDQGGLGLPSRDYYFKTDSATVKIREAYKIYIKNLLSLSGIPAVETEKTAGSILALETAMASVSKTPVELRDPIGNYHKISVSSIPDLKKMLTLFGVTADTVLIGQPEFYKGLHGFLDKEPLETLKNYLRFHVLNDDAEWLSHDFVDAKFEFTKLLTGQKQMKERWKRATSLVDQQLGDNLGHMYVKQYFTSADKERINLLIDNIIATFAERIQQLEWMSDSTKKKALVKLHAIVKKVGYPDNWKDYSSIHINHDDIIANLRGTSNFSFRRAINKIGKPVDRNEWQMTPPTINAYYDPTQNNINFPAGILQPPFYFSSGDDAINYGAIGLVIGHEITHGFDDQGRQYDGDGNLKDWWSAEDAKRFKERAQFIINQYNGYIAVDTFHLNGQLTEGENIADNGGLMIAYAAFKKTTQGKSNEKMDGFTPDQRFFLAYAQVWRVKTRKERLITLTLTNSHSSPMWRVNGAVSNMPSFYDAFQVQPTDSMYRPDSLRVKIW